MTAKRARDGLDDVVPTGPLPTPREFLTRVITSRRHVDEQKLGGFLEDGKRHGLIVIQLNVAAQMQITYRDAFLMCLALFGMAEDAFFDHFGQQRDMGHVVVLDPAAGFLEGARLPCQDLCNRIETEQCTGLKRGGIKRPKDRKFFPAQVTSGHSGGGKTTYCVTGAHLAFDGVGDGASVMTFYTTGSNDGKRAIKVQGDPEKKMERNAECEKYMFDLIRDAAATLRAKYHAAEYLHLVIDECGQCPGFIPGVVSTLEATNGRLREEAPDVTLLLTLCSTGADSAVNGPIASDHTMYVHQQLKPWTVSDMEKYFGPKRWPRVKACGGLLALGSNARCAFLMSKVLPKMTTPSEILRSIASEYRDLNGLKSLSEDELKGHVQAAMQTAVLARDFEAAREAIGGDSRSASVESYRKANRLGLLTYHREDPEPGLVKVPELKQGYYQMSAALLVMCLSLFGYQAPPVGTYDDLERLAAMYYAGVAMAVGLAPTVTELRAPVPPTGSIGTAAAKLRDEKDTAITAKFPSVLERDGDDRLKLPERGSPSFIALINGPRAPAWDVAVGWSKRDGTTGWWLVQVKHTAEGPKKTIYVRWPPELSKLGYYAPPSDRTAWSALTRTTYSDDEESEMATTARYVKSTVNATRRVVASNGKVDHPCPSSPDMVEIGGFPGPFGVLASDMRPEAPPPDEQDHTVTLRPLSAAR